MSVNAVEQALSVGVDYGMLVTLYGETLESEKRYSPAQCIACREQAIQGKPDPKHITELRLN